MTAAMSPRPSLLLARATWRGLVAAYGLLILYGSLFPLSGWQFPDDMLAWLSGGLPRSSSRADNLANVLAYVPLGFALVLAFGARRRAVLAAVLCGAALSFAIETLQTAIPTRIASIADLATNMAGTAVGALVAIVAVQGMQGAHAQRWLRMFRATAQTRAGLLACALWALAQTFPFVPSIDVSNLRAGVAPLYHALVGSRPIELQATLAYALSSFAIALTAIDVMQRSSWRATRVTVFLAAVLLLKVPVVGRQLSLEAVLGIGVICVVLPLVLRIPRRARLALAIMAAIIWMVLTQTAAEGGPTRPFNWIPFLAHLTRPLIGMVVMLEAAWPVMLLAYALRQSVDLAQARVVAWVGGTLIVAMVFALEWVQQFIPGRVGDLTAPAIAAVVWFLAWRLMREPQPARSAAG